LASRLVLLTIPSSYDNAFVELPANFGRVAVGRYCASVGFFRASNALVLITSFDVRFSAVNSEGRTKWIADAHRGDRKRFAVRSDEKLTAFLEAESAIRAFAELS
jgi:hypothetical protein